MHRNIHLMKEDRLRQPEFDNGGYRALLKRSCGCFQPLQREFMPRRTGITDADCKAAASWGCPFGPPSGPSRGRRGASSDTLSLRWQTSSSRSSRSSAANRMVQGWRPLAFAKHLPRYIVLFGSTVYASPSIHACLNVQIRWSDKPYIRMMIGAHRSSKLSRSECKAVMLGYAKFSAGSI
jgi:hypothetical protein